MQAGITAEENLQHVQQLLMQNILHGCFWDQSRRRGPGLIAESSPHHSAFGHDEPETLNRYLSLQPCGLQPEQNITSATAGNRFGTSAGSLQTSLEIRRPCPELGYLRRLQAERAL